MATYKSEILIGGESVWETEDSVSKRTVQLDVSRFTGRKELKFRLKKTGGDGPTPPPPSPYDVDPEEHWWYWPDPTVLANNNQRLFTSENTGLNLDDFTFITCVDIVGWTDANLFWLGWDNIAPYNWELSHTMYFGTNHMYGLTSDNGLYPVAYPVVFNMNANAKWLFSYSYKNLGNNLSDGRVYGRRPGAPTEIDFEGSMEAPPFNTSKRMQVYGWPNLGSRCIYGKTYWFAIYNRGLTSIAELDDIYDKTVMPYNLSDLVYYVDFSQVPAATITPNVDTLGVGDLGVQNWANIVPNGP